METQGKKPDAILASSLGCQMSAKATSGNTDARQKQEGTWPAERICLKEEEVLRPPEQLENSVLPLILTALDLSLQSWRQPS